MKTLNAPLTKHPELDEFAYLLKENGFTVIIPRREELPTWFHFFKDGKMGYVQKSYYSGFDFSSEHKPCKNYGTGLGVHQMVDLTIENAIDALNEMGWKNDRNYNKINHYKSADEYINAPTNEWAKNEIL